MEIITQEESARLAELEAVIQRGKETFVEVGTALSEIRNSRIYRQQFGTFEDYCKERWGWNASRARQMIGAAETVTNLSTVTNVTPQTESQARPLAKLPAEQQPAAWEKAQEKAKEEGKPVTARHVEAAVKEVMPPKEKPETEEEPEPLVVDGADEERIKPEPGVALVYARTAIDALNKIPKRDPSRKKAISMIESWLVNNTKKQ